MYDTEKPLGAAPACTVYVPAWLVGHRAAPYAPSGRSQVTVEPSGAVSVGYWGWSSVETTWRNTRSSGFGRVKVKLAPPSGPAEQV